MTDNPVSKTPEEAAREIVDWYHSTRPLDLNGPTLANCIANAIRQARLDAFEGAAAIAGNYTDYNGHLVAHFSARLIRALAAKENE